VNGAWFGQEGFVYESVNLGARFAKRLAALGGRKLRKNGFDRSVTVRSNGGSAFVCNKTAIRGMPRLPGG